MYSNQEYAAQLLLQRTLFANSISDLLNGRVCIHIRHEMHLEMQKSFEQIVWRVQRCSKGEKQAER